MRKLPLLTLAAALGATPAFAGVLFEEHFDDTAVGSRGWYDSGRVQISTSEHIDGSSGSAVYRFRQGATVPDTGGGLRHKFTPSESVYLRYYVKHSTNWTGSNKSYHPHIFQFLTNKSSDYSGLAETRLTTYVEENEGYLQFFMQDAQNIDTSRINVDLTNVTENRGVAGCNGNSDGYPSGCYKAGTTWRNEKKWKSPSMSFADSAGPTYKGDWHMVEAYMKMNSIVNGKGVNDGVMQMWLDGKLVIDHTKVLLRTGRDPDMQFNQFIIGPYIGDGSPVDQTFWIDEMLLATERTAIDDGLAPNPPRLLDVR